uniref:Uncharacterized protein n=1 Tax=Glossina brevipalpis TaxID=37001 RepID=A0A1A9WI18_9MUSC
MTNLKVLMNSDEKFVSALYGVALNAAYNSDSEKREDIPIRADEGHKKMRRPYRVVYALSLNEQERESIVRKLLNFAVSLVAYFAFTFLLEEYLCSNFTHYRRKRI